jgi:hypothetical protein
MLNIQELNPRPDCVLKNVKLADMLTHYFSSADLRVRFLGTIPSSVEFICQLVLARARLYSLGPNLIISLGTCLLGFSNCVHNKSPFCLRFVPVHITDI